MVSKRRLRRNIKTNRIPIWPSEIQMCPLERQYREKNFLKDRQKPCQLRGLFVHDLKDMMIRSHNIKRGGFSKRLHKRIGKYLPSEFYQREWKAVKNAEQQLYSFLTTTSFGKRLMSSHGKYVERKIQIPLERFPFADDLGYPLAVLMKYEISGKLDMAFGNWIFEVKSGKKETLGNKLQALLYSFMGQAKFKNKKIRSAVLLLGGSVPAFGIRQKELPPNSKLYEKRLGQLKVELRKTIAILELLDTDLDSTIPPRREEEHAIIVIIDLDASSKNGGESEWN